MPESAVSDSATIPRSRRAVLAAAAGAAAALAGALARPSRAEAAAGSALIIGSEANNAGTANTQLIANSNVVTFKLYQTGPGTALMGYTTPTSGLTRGVYGRVDSANGDGVQGRSGGMAGTGAAVRGYGGQNDGVVGSTDNVAKYGVLGSNSAINGDGVAGSAGVGGSGVIGFSTSGYGVFSSGTLGTNSFLQMEQVSDPGVAPASMARLYVRATMSGQELCVQFESGVVQVIASEP